jgi:CHAT domain
MLWAGARQVIATNWRIWDTVFTSRFDLLLAHALRSSHDVAASLRELQVEYLDDWRRSNHDFGEHRMEGLPGGSASLPLPMIWGAYCCIGVLW